MIFELDLVTGYGIGFAVEDEKARRGSALVYTADKPLFRDIAMHDWVGFSTGPLALANVPHCDLLVDGFRNEINSRFR